MHIFIASVHHTGTQFTCKLFVDAGYEQNSKWPEGRKGTPDPANYFHRSHIADSVGTELRHWLDLGIPIVVPIRHPIAVLKSWLVRKKDPLELKKQFELLIKVVDPYKPLYLPLDSPDREDYLTDIRLKVDLGLKTDWKPYRSKLKGSDHRAQLEPVAPTAAGLEAIMPFLFHPLFENFYGVEKVFPRE